MNEVNVNVKDIFKPENVVKNFLNFTLKEIMTILGAETGSLFLFDSEKKELILDSFYNSTELHIKGIKQRLGEGISGKVASFKKPILVKDIRQDARFNCNGFTHYHSNSFISIPLFSPSGLLGLMNITDKKNGDNFTEKDLDFATALTKYACVISDNLMRSAQLKEEKETLDKQKALLEKYATIGKLASGVVHEINNPLDGVIRYTNMLLHKAESNSLVAEYLLEIKKGLGRIGNITSSLLEFSRYVGANSSKVKKYIDINHVIDESLDIFNSRIKAGVVVSRQLQDNLPKILDIGISHVIMNIIKNALDSMPQGGVLKISSKIEDSNLQISVSDTGIGIPEGIKNLIFDPFFTTKSIDKGTGLGLAITKEIINKYEGKIIVESAQGQGSTFYVLIPTKYFENV